MEGHTLDGEDTQKDWSFSSKAQDNNILPPSRQHMKENPPRFIHWNLHFLLFEKFTLDFILELNKIHLLKDHDTHLVSWCHWGDCLFSI